MSNGTIEIFCKTNTGYRIAATFEDDDENVAFIHETFIEAIKHFLKTSGDPVDVFPYLIDVIKEKVNNFISKLYDPPSKVKSRLLSIITFIENNQSII